MHEIKHLAEEIREELDDAEKYAREAAKHTEDSPEDASTYADLSRQELGHANKLHEMAVRHIEKAKDAGLHPTAPSSCSTATCRSSPPTPSPSSRRPSPPASSPAPS